MGNITPFILLACGFIFALSAGAWLIAPPEQRTHLRTAFYGTLRRSGGLLLRIASPLRLSAGKGRDLIRSVAEQAQTQRRLILALSAIVVAPLLLALAMQSHRTLEGFDDSVPDQDVVIASLLRGEQLAPPPPLPPQVFATAEVELLRPNIGFASREWGKLDGEFQQRLLQIFRIMEERHGYRMALIEGYRSPERQTMLAAMGPHVTNAGAYQSYHQVGLGADCAFYRNGKLVISEKDPWAMHGYRLYGELAQAFGLTWGGNWKMLDLGHVELRKPDVLRRARAAAQ